MKKILPFVIFSALIGAAPASATEHFACNMKGMSAKERLRHQELTKTLLAAAQEKLELSNGYGAKE